VKAVIDHDRCTGHGRCYVTAPELFTDDDYGYGQVIGDGDVQPAQRDAAEAAVNACPEQAVTIKD
jgi:ferredoxin